MTISMVATPDGTKATINVNGVPALEINDSTKVVSALSPYSLAGGGGGGASLGSATPLMDGVAAAGTAVAGSHEDHVHPTDTSRQATLVSGTNIKTVNSQSLLGSGDIVISGGGGASAGSATPLMDGTATAGVAAAVSREDHVHPKDTSKQDTLVSGTNIKTVNNTSILGAGNITISGGGSDDGVTAANICDIAMDGRTIINAFQNIYFKDGVGVAQAFGYGGANAGTTNTAQYGSASHASSASGTGATSGIFNAFDQVTTGTTATGYALLHKLCETTAFPPPTYSFYEVGAPLVSTGSKIAASAVCTVSALSDATNTYTLCLTLLGTGPATNLAPAATHSGFMLTYTHSVNSGLFQINYRGSDGLLKTVDTTVAPVVALGSAVRFVAKAERTGAGTSTVVIDLAGTTYTITDSSFGSTPSYVKAGVGVRILKSVGTTNVNAQLRATSAARNFT